METERSRGIVAYLKNKHVLFTLLYHLLTLPFISYIVLSHQYGSGPCNPGLDLVAVFLGGLVDVIMIIVGLGFISLKGRSYIGLLLVNLSALAIMVVVSCLS